MERKKTTDPDTAAFWASLRRSAELVRGLPTWTQAGIVLSNNFEGFGDAQPPSKDATKPERSPRG